MARLDVEVSRITLPGGFVSLVFDMDDADIVGEDWSACELFAIKLTNTTGRTAHVLMRRSNNAPWRDTDIGAGDHQFNTGGPVRKVGDLPSYELRV